ncbi:MAG: bifunctional riboflavin kinase/FAD synthetase [Vicinamibacteria bacterium]
MPTSPGTRPEPPLPVRLDDLRPRGWPSPAVAIGNFDGVHLGHQALVRRIVERARATTGSAVVLTFDPHPARVLAPERAPEALLTLEQRAELLAGLGVDRLAVLPFDAAMAGLAPEAFAERVLAGALGARAVVVGEQFRFGRGRSGDVAMLRAAGARLGFEVLSVAPVVEAGVRVSSSRVRAALAAGEVELAGRLLGRLPFVDGRVVRGDGRGRQLGFPTANLDVLNQALPGPGVYAAWCRLPDGRMHGAAANVGRRPTFGGGDLTVEAHLLDHAGDLYDRTLRLSFVRRLREERRFDGGDELARQIGADVHAARAALAEARAL